MPYKRNLLPKQAFENLANNPNSLFVDVRSTAEHKFVGFPDNSVLIPWSDEPNWQPDKEEHASTAGRESHISTPIASATVKISLSPRPDRFTTSVCSDAICAANCMA